MAPLTVVEDLNVLRDLPSGLFPRFITSVMHQFILQRAPETLHRGIVVAVASPTHGRGHAELAYAILIRLGTILRAAIGVTGSA